MIGSRIALMVGAGAVAIGAIIGVTLGLLAAFATKWLDDALAAALDILIAFPTLLLAMLVVAASDTASLWSAILALGIALSAIVGRLTRILAKRVLQMDYITAARTSGTSWPQIVIKHVLPNIWPTLMVSFSLQFGLAIIVEASLSYLGLGAPPPNASWERLLQEAQGTVYTAPFGAVAPGAGTARARHRHQSFSRWPARHRRSDAKERQMTLLSVNGLTISAGAKVLVSDLSFFIAAGSRMGLIGESGSGKSLTAMAITGLLPRNIVATGSILLDGQKIIGAPEHSLAKLRGAFTATVFQESLTALDPLMRLGRQIEEPLRRRYKREGLDPKDIKGEVLSLMERVSLPQPQRIALAYPFEVSGGQRQRVAIAMALACRPRLLIADEPTTALDVTTQAEVLKLLDELVRDLGMALLFISHDLPVVANVVEQVTVLRNGVAVEQGDVRAVLGSPQQAYTKSLVDAARAFDQALGAR